MPNSNNIKFFFLMLLGLSFASCQKELNFPDQPVISNLRMEIFSNNTAQLSVDFTDGDGDVGEFEPEDTATVTFKNLRIDYFELVDTAWVKTRGDDLLSATILDLGTSKAIEGTIKRRFDQGVSYYDPLSANEFYRYEVVLVDRARNESNVLVSPTFVKPLSN